MARPDHVAEGVGFENPGISGRCAMLGRTTHSLTHPFAQRIGTKAAQHHQGGQGASTSTARTTSTMAAGMVPSGTYPGASPGRGAGGGWRAGRQGRRDARGRWRPSCAAGRSGRGIDDRRSQAPERGGVARSPPPPPGDRAPLGRGARISSDQRAPAQGEPASPTNGGQPMHVIEQEGSGGIHLCQPLRFHG